MPVRLTPLLLCGVLFVGCATYKPPVKRDIVADRTYSKSYDAVWNNLIEWFATNNIPIKTLDKNSGLISTEYNLRNKIKESCDCGTSGFGVAVSDDIIGNFNVLTRKLDDGTIKVNISSFFKTTVKTSSFSSAVADDVSSSNCESTGYLEKQNLDFAGR